MVMDTWHTVELVDKWLDVMVDVDYANQPLAQDWARISKIGEELGEAIQEFILVTGQNPRKGRGSSMGAVLDELADVVSTGILAIQHFTKDTSETQVIIERKMLSIGKRVPTEEQ